MRERERERGSCWEVWIARLCSKAWPCCPKAPAVTNDGLHQGAVPHMSAVFYRSCKLHSVIGRMEVPKDCLRPPRTECILIH